VRSPADKRALGPMTWAEADIRARWPDVADQAVWVTNMAITSMSSERIFSIISAAPKDGQAVLWKPVLWCRCQRRERDCWRRVGLGRHGQAQSGDAAH
jgi:hypothetical protein